jgi:hypothetical protein
MANGKKKPSMGAWIDTVWNGTGKFVRLETTDGVQRSGKLSGFRTKVVKFNGEEQHVIIELELNGDPSDCVPLAVLDKVSIDD